MTSKATAMGGSLLILIGIGLVSYIAYGIFGMAYAMMDFDDTESLIRLVFFICLFSFIFIALIMLEYFLLKSADIPIFGIGGKLNVGKKPNVWIQTGIIVKNQGKYNDALYSFNFALRKTQLKHILLEIAEVYQLIGNTDDAVRYLKKVIELDSSNQKAKKLLDEFDSIRTS